MCGIFFCAWNATAPTQAALERAVAELRHRGPDHQAVRVREGYALGHTRLAIIDLSASANQPFEDGSGRWTLLYNGEIYNYRELRKELVARGYNPRTASDTEVLLELLTRDGVDRTLPRLRGMFAFILRDRATGRITVARDHFGQKPLYYFSEAGITAVASDIRALLAVKPSVQPAADQWPIYLASLGILTPDATFFAGIKAIPAGSYLEGPPEALALRRYFAPWQLFDHDRYREAGRMTETDAVDELECLLQQAVERHLVSDVPVGVMLSGGIDSSLVFWHTGKASERLTTFTKVSPGIESIPTSIVPRLLADRPASSYFRLERPEAYVEGLQDFVWSSQAPSRWGGGPPMRSLCDAARQLRTIVLLSGDAVDEYAAGYRTLEPLIDGFDGDLTQLHSILALDPAIAPKNGAGDRYRDYQRSVRSEILAHLGDLGDPRETFLQATLLHDTAVFLQSCNLPHSDAYSMAASVELRNPLLDLDLVAFMVNQPGRRKFGRHASGHRNKLLFRELAERRIGSYVNVGKEGTRNYSMAISRPEFWNLGAFAVGLHLSMPSNPPPKLLFKLVNLEMHQRIFFEDETDFLPHILTAQGRASILPASGSASA